MAAVRLGLAVGLLQIFNQNIWAEEGVVTAQCCSQVFLSSSGILSDTQSAVLGIYTKTNTKIANNSHPVYVKHQKEDSQYFLYFRNKESGPQGWIVGKELLEDSFYISTRNDQLDCANGIFGGFDRGQLDSYDPKFSIECHSDQVRIDCCKNVKISSSGAIEGNQGAALGDYVYEGDFNGHPYYKGTHNMFLFYRKKGSGPDGWMISPKEKDEDLFSVTTRQKEYCPSTLSTAYDRDRTRDDTFAVTCQVGELEQDPGASLEPIPPTPINSSAKETMVKSVCFRLLLVIYIAISN